MSGLVDYVSAKSALVTSLEEYLGISDVEAGVARAIAAGDDPENHQPEMSSAEKAKANEAVDKLKDQAAAIADAIQGYIGALGKSFEDATEEGDRVMIRPSSGSGGYAWRTFKSDLKEALGYSAAADAIEEMKEEMGVIPLGLANPNKTNKALDEIETQANRLAEAIRDYLRDVSLSYSNALMDSENVLLAVAPSSYWG